MLRICDHFLERVVLTNDYHPGNVAFSVVGKQYQLGNEERVVEPDPKHSADTQPPHGVHHKVQSEFHGCAPPRRPGDEIFERSYMTPDTQIHSKIAIMDNVGFVLVLNQLFKK